MYHEFVQCHFKYMFKFKEKMNELSMVIIKYEEQNADKFTYKNKTLKAKHFPKVILVK